MKELRKIKNPWLHKPGYDCICASRQKAEQEMGFTGCELEETDYEKFRREQMERFEDDITEGRCYPEMPEGQFIRSK